MSGQVAPAVVAGGGPFPVEAVRAAFPALERAGYFVFFDNAAGAQIPQRALDAVNQHLTHHNVQRGGRYPQSITVDAVIARARSSVAAFINARRAQEIAFGMNATSFIRMVSLAIGQTLQERAEIVVTDLDHEANVATWLALVPLGAKIVWWKVRADARLHVEDLEPLVSARTRVIACTLASNVLGSIVDVRAAADVAHAAGAEIFVDAVHCAPHAPIDVQALDCDYLVCSGYKIFAPHMGFLYGRYERLLSLPTVRADFIPDEPPDKLEPGTFIFENVAGLDAAIGYLAQLGRQLAGKPGEPQPDSLREDTRRAMEAIRLYEQGLTRELLRVLRSCKAQIYGITDEASLGLRVPTLCFNLPGVQPQAVTAAAARAGIAIRDGHMYAPRIIRRLGVDVTTGVVRASLAHYNTVAEIERLGTVLAALT